MAMKLNNTVSCEQGTAHSTLQKGGRRSRRSPARRPPSPGSRESRRAAQRGPAAKTMPVSKSGSESRGGVQKEAVDVGATAAQAVR
eukprot:5382579-Alexandrium_andersonii.AAC.1